MKSTFVDKFVYDKKEEQRIITHEGMMREAYAKAVACYSPLFAQYGCSLEVSLYWVDFSTRKGYDHRLPFRIGYACYVCKAVACYSPLFAQYGCSLEVSLYWVDFSTRKGYDHRLPFRIGYACYVCCEVQRGGKVVHVKSTDGEADYYTLSTEWMVSSIDRNFFQTKVSLYSDADKAEDMEELLRQLSNSQQETGNERSM